MPVVKESVVFTTELKPAEQRRLKEQTLQELQ